MIYQYKVDRCLAAITSKNLDEIVASGVKIYGLKANFNKTDLQTWLNKRIDLINSGKTFTDAQITNAVGTIYNSLSTNDQIIASHILNDEFFTEVPSSTTANEKLVLIALYNAITKP